MSGYGPGDPYDFIVPASDVRSPRYDVALMVRSDSTSPGMLYYTPVSTQRAPNYLPVVEAAIVGVIAWLAKTVRDIVPPTTPRVPAY